MRCYCLSKQTTNNKGYDATATDSQPNNFRAFQQAPKSNIIVEPIKRNELAYKKYNSSCH